jgi:hypothetical protein
LSPSRLGMGPRIHFWHDVWCGKAALKTIFPYLYLIAREKETVISDYLNSSKISFHWNPSFTRAVQDWELESLDSFSQFVIFFKNSSKGDGSNAVDSS